MRLVHRFGIVFLVVVLVAGAVLVVTFDAHRTDVEEQANTSVADRATLSASILDDRLEEQRRTVAVGGINPDLAAHGADRQGEALERFVASTAFDGASVVDEDGTVQSFETTSLGFESEAIVGDDFSDRTYVQRALAGEQHVSDPFRAQTGNTVVVISAPLVVDGEVVGSINGGSQLEETGLFDGLSGDDEREAVTVATETETLYTTADRFDQTVAHSADLETVDWTVTAHRDRAAVDARINRLAVFQAVSGIALLGSIIVFGGWVYRSKIRRIGQFADRVRALERREYDAGPSFEGAAEWRRIDDALERLGTALARREQMLLVLNRILRHNLRNSLNVVAGRASDLEDQLDGPERESAREIRLVTGELLTLADRARMTEELLDPVGEESPRIDLAAVVHERIVQFGLSGADDAKPNLTVTMPDRAVAVCGPEIAVAIDELLANIADHAGPEPTVDVTVETDDDVVRILVADDGPGIPADEAAVITGNRKISQVSHTGGIGLWLVDWIVTQYDGRLLIPAADSSTAAIADGTTVVLEFARAPDSTADADDEERT
ncbi:sensor histidine kinase [Natronorubrum texcoconense]|uniref:histidine kinase n=1 Tax=Natronorubrum texcoconense TaxID=1095776 RepID=A0A1G8UWT0_9EURY|nr:sensor histidine kinase [Natronorubrum texcoconense]SDJ57555.1 Signal transduction histidine kinase [Natronorubrum texcoconense]